VTSRTSHVSLLTGLLVVLVLSGTARPSAAHVPDPAWALAAKTCSDFVAFRAKDTDGTPFRYVATHVRRVGPVTCPRVKLMIRSTYGARGGYRRQLVMGRYLVYWRGGWRCSNGAGGAVCSNLVHEAWSITADVGL
jgi:hypothetical protein